MKGQKIVFFSLILICLTPYVSPLIALILGLLMALFVGNPFQRTIGKTSRNLIQFSVILFGFGVNLSNVLKIGKDSIIFTTAAIFGTLILGWVIGKLSKIGDKTSVLISSGTAISGSDAIGIVAPTVNADSEDISDSLCTIFILNSIALFAFPIIGHALSLTENQFGIWAGVAIHDMSSVVGASADYGTGALQAATTVKLIRVIWIVPITLIFAFIYSSKDAGRKIRFAAPWFVFLFLLTTILRTYSPNAVPPSIFDSFINLAKASLTVSLFLIGSGLSREALRKMRLKSFLQGVLLWVIISLVSLLAVWKWF